LKKKEQHKEIQLFSETENKGHNSTDIKILIKAATTRLSCLKRFLLEKCSIKIQKLYVFMAFDFKI
jgi:hypothetical protein